MLATLARRLWRRDLDRAREARVRNEYDLDRGYDGYHSACRAHSSRPADSAADPIARRGYERLRVLDSAGAGSLIEKLEADVPIVAVKKDAERLQGFHLEDGPFAREVFEAVLGPDVDALIARHFASEYLIHWFTITRTAPGNPGGYDSFLWHCDRGPTAHLKLLVYLNSTTEHGGNTELLDIECTQGLAASGYLFGPVRARRADLSELAKSAGIDYRPRSFELAAGEALLLAPGRVLHRGVRPLRSHRYVLTLCLLPSPVPWREALDRDVMSDLSRDPKWHEDARTLLDRLKSSPGA